MSTTTLQDFPTLVTTDEVAGENGVEPHTRFDFLATDFQETKSKFKKWCSTAFWFRGHQWCIEVYPDGYGDEEGKSLSVFLKLMGPADAKHTATCCLCVADPWNPDNDYKKKILAGEFTGGQGRGFASMIALKDIAEITTRRPGFPHLLLRVEMISCKTAGQGESIVGEKSRAYAYHCGASSYEKPISKQIELKKSRDQGAALGDAVISVKVEASNSKKGTDVKVVLDCKTMVNKKTNARHGYSQYGQNRLPLAMDIVLEVKWVRVKDQVDLLDRGKYNNRYRGKFTDSKSPTSFSCTKLLDNVDVAEELQLCVTVHSWNVTSLCGESNRYNGDAKLSGLRDVWADIHKYRSLAEQRSRATKASEGKMIAQKRALQDFAKGLMQRIPPAHPVDQLSLPLLEEEELRCTARLNEVKKAREARSRELEIEEKARAHFDCDTDATRRGATLPPVLQKQLYALMSLTCVGDAPLVLRPASEVGNMFKKKTGKTLKEFQKEHSLPQWKWARCIDLFEQDDAKGMVDAKLINKVIQDRCHVPTAETAHHKEVVDKVSTFCKNAFPLSVAECYVGGSSKKGTALNGNSDVDIVLFINDVPEVGLSGWMPELLAFLRRSLEQAVKAGEVPGCRFEKGTRFALQFSCDGVSIDLLPCPALDPERARVLMEKHPAEEQGYSKALTKLQVEYVLTHTEPEERDIIRLLKLWRDDTWRQEGSHAGMSSYMLELFVVNATAFQEAVPNSPDKPQLVSQVLSMMRSARCNRPKRVTPNLRLLSGWKEEDLLPQHRKGVCSDPVVIDPANAHGNVASRMSPTDWVSVREEATEAKFREFLQKCANLPGIRLKNVTGPSAATINGVYKRTDEVVNGRAVFLKLDSGSASRCCWYAPDGQWTVSPTTQKDGNEAKGWAYTKATGLPHPAAPGQAWWVYGGDGFVHQPGVTVQVLSAPDVDR